jgi:hypothetical protein
MQQQAVQPAKTGNSNAAATGIRATAAAANDIEP